MEGGRIMNVSNEVRRLTELKDKLDEAKAAKARLEGELHALQKQAEAEFGTSDPTELRKRADDLLERATKLREQVRRGMVVLEKEVADAC